MKTTMIKMKTTVVLGNRRSGKSTLAAYEFRKDPESTCYITISNYAVDDFCDNNPDLIAFRNNMFSQRNDLMGRSFKIGIIDELSLFDKNNQKRFYETLYLNDIQDLYVFCSKKDYDEMKKLYSDAIDFVMESKLNSIGFVKIIEAAEKRGFDIDVIEHLFYSWITDPDIKIINNPNVAWTEKEKQ